VLKLEVTSSDSLDGLFVTQTFLTYHTVVNNSKRKITQKFM